MRLIAYLLLLTPVVYGAAVEKCAWGESYWCSEFSIAKNCGAVKHCTMTVWKNQKTEVDNTEVCEFCQAIIKDVHTFISSKKTESEIAHFLSTACAIIPDTKISQECKSIVETYLPELIDLIVSNVNPQTICRLMHLCTGSGIEDTVQHADVVVPANQLVKIPLNKPAVETTTQSGVPKICTDCQAFFGDIVQMVLSNESLSQLETLIDQEVCSELGSFRGECNALVKEYLSLAVQYVRQFMDPKVLCQSMGFCTATSDRARMLLAIVKMTPLSDALSKVGSAESCLVCTTVVTELRTAIRSSDVQDKVKQFIKTDVCGEMESLKKGCIQIVDLYSSVAFEYLASFLNPEIRCSSFGFCDSDKSSTAAAVREATPPVKSAVAPTADTECVLCEFIMKEIISLIQNNYTEAKIMEALDKVCSILPSTIEKSCLDFVNTYGRAIISILETEVNPEMVCSFLGLCKSNAKLSSLQLKPKVNDAETCLICETAVQYVEAMISDNATVQEIEAIVDKVCNFLPDTMKSECISLVQQYAPLIVSYILKNYTPKEVCTLIKACDGAVDVHMVNLAPAKSHVAKDCSYGPSYWCASRRNADECGAVEHCQKYVWVS